MNREVVSNRLMKISTMLSEEGGSSRGASAMLTLAKELVSFNPVTFVVDKIKELSRLADDFRDKHAKALKELADAEKKVKEAKRKLGLEYDVWEKETGFEKIRDEVLRMAQTSLTLGEKVDEIVDGLVVAKRNSTQPLYKEQFLYLASTLNAAETAKFMPILETCFKKTFTELKTGVSILDDKIESIPTEAKEFADARGLDIEKMLGMKSAGVIGDAMDTLREFGRQLTMTLRTWADGLFAKIADQGRELDQVSAKITKELDKISAAI